ncbi:MAG: TetR/AcrR family transcriptional regulator [Ktedonobacterales bacterium]
MAEQEQSEPFAERSADPQERTGDLADERRSQILEAALTVFADKGLHDARMEDIASKAGVSKGLVYLYYKSKDAVIEALLRSLFTLELHNIQAMLKGTDSIGERLLRITRTFATEFDRFVVAQPLMLEFYALAARHRSVREFMTGALEEIRGLFAELIRQGVEQGEFRATTNPDEAAMTVIALLEGIALIITMAPHAISWREQADASMQLLVAGLTAPDEGAP